MLGSVLAIEPSPAPGPVVAVRVGIGLDRGTEGGPIEVDAGVFGVAANALCVAAGAGAALGAEVYRLTCSSSISAFASAMARFDRAILSVVSSVLCECSTAECDLACHCQRYIRRPSSGSSENTPSR